MTQEFVKTPILGQPGKIRPLSSSPVFMAEIKVISQPLFIIIMHRNRDRFFIQQYAVFSE